MTDSKEQSWAYATRTCGCADYGEKVYKETETMVAPTTMNLQVKVSGIRKARKKINNVIAETNTPNISHPTRTLFDEHGNRFQTEFRGSVTTVSVTLPNGIKAKGHSRCDEADQYNRDFGIALASVRATQRALRKYEQWLSKEGYRLNG